MLDYVANSATGVFPIQRGSDVAADEVAGRKSLDLLEIGEDIASHDIVIHSTCGKIGMREEEALFSALMGPR